MKLFYNSDKIYYSVTDKDVFFFTHSTNLPLTELEIDEIDPENKAICLDLIRYGNTQTVNEAGETKYYIENGELNVRDNWIEKTYEM